MKIGILTQHFLLNYGGIIQNFALQQVLLKLGHDPLTFEHDTCYSRTRWFLRTIKHILRTRSFRNLPVYPIYKGRIGNKNFIKFVLKNIKSVPVTDFTPSLTAQYGIDAYVVGSDQVWRPAFNLGPRLGNMFLNFADDKVKKFSYAASFGCKEWEYTKEQERACSKLARRFDAISVREDDGLKFIPNAVHLLDPVFLADTDIFHKLADSVQTPKCKVVGYVLDKTDEHFDKNIAYENISVEEYLSYIKNADLVVTDSFHGTCFAILFNRFIFIFIE